MRPVGALVIGGDYRGLGIVRSLGRHGIEVWVVHGAETLATHSRYCRRALRHRPDNDEDLVRFLLRLAAAQGLDGWVLFPTSDETAWLVSRHRDELSRHYRVTTPGYGVYAAAADKASVYTIATALGLDVPQTWFPRAVADLDDLDASFPLVIKPTTRQRANALTLDKAWRADDRTALRQRYDDARRAVPPDEIMVQEWVPGDGHHQYAFAAVCSRGDPRLSVVARRTRQYPRDFGRASTYVETVDHPGVVKDATRLLQELRIDGLVEVEFKQDEVLGALRLLDVNVRVWGWHSLGAAAGVDFAYAAYQLALGADLPIRTATAGLRWTRLAVDVPYALLDIASGRLRLADYLRSLRGPLVGPLAARDDPLPAAFEIPLLLLTLLRQRRDRRIAHH